MNNFLKAVPFLNKKNVCSSLDQYYQKISYANSSRYRSRMIFKSTPYPPDELGNEDFQITAKKEKNIHIRRILQYKVHPETPLFPKEYSLEGPPKGRIYEKLPFKYRVEKGKSYSLCTCGYSNNQNVMGDKTQKLQPKFRPIKYIADETKDVWFCNCKQSSNRPFCDGTHRLDIVQNEKLCKIKI